MLRFVIQVVSVLMDFIGVKIDAMRNKTVLNKVIIQKFIDYLNAERSDYSGQ